MGFWDLFGTYVWDPAFAFLSFFRSFLNFETMPTVFIAADYNERFQASSAATTTAAY
jgi:hypothetical protein